MYQKIRYVISLSFLCFILFTGCQKMSDRYDKREELYSEVDKEIEKVAQYDAEKERRINNLKHRIFSEQSQDVKRELTDWLITEYESYISDSALYYINQNLENPAIKSDARQETRLLIKKADVAAHAGLFGEALSILNRIDRASLDSILLEQYYSAYCDLYQYQSEYTNSSEYGRNNEKLRELYIDSISQVALPSSINYIIYNAAKNARDGNFAKAQKMLLDKISQYHSGERNYSILASILADIYKQQGDDDNYHKYISLSVISDLKGAVKENMAIRALATECFEEGSLERADKYLRQSFADANFYSARMRNAQSSRMLPVIGEAYNNQQKKLNHQLRLFVIFISILALGFILIAIFAFLQVKKVRAVNKKTKEMLEKVSTLSEQLSVVNKELSEANKELQTSNTIKGEYAVLFMEYSSLAISSLQHYQQSLKVAATQGSLPALIKKIDSASIENKTLGEFYTRFDEAILNIYPHFVEKFNSLLKPEDRIELKPKEGLNTELRVFALMKIGINDSEKIAKFLRCSLSTVYTYRSKMKKKALDPDNFENLVLNL